MAGRQLFLVPPFVYVKEFLSPPLPTWKILVPPLALFSKKKKNWIPLFDTQKILVIPFRILALHGSKTTKNQTPLVHFA